MQTFTRSLRKSIVIAAAACAPGLLGPGPRATAQVSTTPAADGRPAAMAEPAVELPPFEVRTDKDTGYSAQNTTSGSRLNTKLADTPAAISVFTREFIEDIGAASIEDLTAYSLNADNNLVDGDGGSLTNSDPILTIRGIAGGGAGQGNTGRFTNFFQSSVTQDTFNLERAELTRGPNSVLFGVGSPAGGFNVATKKADPRRPRYSASFRFGSWDEARTSIDVNQPILANRLAVRLNVAHQDRNDWRAFAYDRELRYQLNARWQVARNTRVDVEYENGRREYANAPRSGVLDSITPWITAGRRLDTQAGAPFPANAGIQVLTTANSLVYDTSGRIIYNVRNQSVGAPAGGTPGIAAVAGEENPNIFDFGLVPRQTFLGGPAYGTSNDYGRTLAVVSHELLRGFFLEAAFNRETTVNQARNTLGTDNRIQVDTNALLPSGAPNPRAGQFYTEQNIVLRDRTTAANDFRLSGSYDLDLSDRWSAGVGRWLGTHRLAALQLWRDADQQDNQQQEALVENPLNTTAPDNNMNRLRRRTYFDLAGPAGQIGLADYRQLPVDGIVNQSDGRAVRTMFVPFGQPRPTRDLTTTNLFVWQASFLRDRLVATAGYRKDRVKTFQSTAQRQAPFGPFAQGLLYPVRNSYADFTYGITRTQGLVAKPLSWVSVFYNHSSSFSLPPRTVQIFPGDFAPASQGETNDYGAKFSLFQGRMFATITYYETTAKRGAGNGGVINYVNGINNVWATLANAGVPEAAGVTVFANGRTSDREADGVEFEFTANPTPAWRLLMNFSTNRTITTNEASEILDYYARNSAFFTQGTRARLIVNGAPGQLAANAHDPGDGVTTIAELLQANGANLTDAFVNPNGVRQLGKPVAQGNLRTTYAFREGPLRPFSIGGGLRWRGERVIAYTSSDPATRREIRGDDSFTVDANLAYRRKLAAFGRNCELTLQLNVSNLLDDDELIIQRVYADATPRTFSLPDPRRWFLTTTVTF